MISQKAIAGLLQYQSLGDLFRIYSITQRDGTDFNLAFIPERFKVPHKEDFDKRYMQQLYDVGFAQAKSGYRWAKQPPMLVDQEESLQSTKPKP